MKLGRIIHSDIETYINNLTIKLINENYLKTIDYPIWVRGVSVDIIETELTI